MCEASDDVAVSTLECIPGGLGFLHILDGEETERLSWSI